MELLRQTLIYFLEHTAEFWQAVIIHLQLSLLALLFATILCIPLGIATSRFGTSARIIINAIGILRVVPSVAVLFVLLPILGTGFTPGLVALTLLAFPPILINTDAGLRGVDPATIESARGMGMTALGRLSTVELPLALPVIIGGIRTATVEVIASATLATFIGAGGLGDFIVLGLSGNDSQILLVGAISVALLATLAEIILGTIQRFVSPRTRSQLQTA